MHIENQVTGETRACNVKDFVHELHELGCGVLIQSLAELKSL